MTKRREVLESVIENDFQVVVVKLGGFSEKFPPCGRRGRPDQLVTLPGLPMHFAEIKTHGGEVEPLQKKDHAMRRKLGVEVWVIWNREQLLDYAREMRHRIDSALAYREASGR